MTQMAVTPWLATLEGGGPASAPVQPDPRFRLEPDAMLAHWRVNGPLRFTVRAPVAGNIVIRTNQQRVANITLAATEAALDCTNPVYSLQRGDGETLWAQACTEGLGRIELLEVGDAVPQRIYQFLVLPETVMEYGPGYGPGYA